MSTTLLRPLSIGEILDGAFAILRRHFPVFFATALIGLAPLIAMQFAFAMTAASMTSGPFSSRLFKFTGVVLISIVLGTVATAFVNLAATQQASDAVLGRKPTIDAGARLGLRKIPIGSVAFFLRTFLVAVGFALCILPGAYLALRTFALFPVIALEPRPAWWSRSEALYRGSWQKILVVSVVAWFIALVPGLVLGMATGLVTLDDKARLDAQTAVLPNLLNLLVTAVTVPFSAVVTTLLYYDMRVRKEGLDVRLMGEALADPVAVAPGA